MQVDPVAGFEDGAARVVGVRARFEAANQPAAHRHRRGQFAYCPDAPLVVEAGERLFVLGPGEAAWIPGGLPHALSARSARTALNLYIEPGATALLGETPALFKVGGLERELVSALADGGRAEAGQPAHERLVDVLFDRLRPARPTGTLLLPADPALAAIQQRWLAGDDRERDLAAWADRLALSPRSLQRRIFAATGLPFRAWRQRVVLTACFDPLIRGLPVKIVAADAGYASASAFVAAFRRTFGVTPGEFCRLE
jgi:AraC-like DNA-binding protein/quercetin dioxygenase-like cupin family protein